MRRFLRTALAAAGLGTCAPLALAQPGPLLPPLEPAPPPGLPLAYLPPAAPDAGARKFALAPPDAAVPKPSARKTPDVPLPKPPAVTYALPAIPPLPKAAPPRIGIDVARPKPAPLPQAPMPRTPAALAAQPPGKLPAFPDTASAGAPPATPGAAAGAPPCGATLCDAVGDPVWRLFPPHDRARVHGFVNGGYAYNASNPDSKFNGPYNSIDRSAEPMLNQAYAVLENGLPADGSWGGGGRVDLLFGLDHFRGQSRGLEVDRDFGERWNGQYYGLAVPQAFVKTGNDAVNFKLGHFYSTVGYETLPAANNFFYSRAYSFQFGQPITHWGAVMTARLARNLEGHAGVVNGWDTLVGRENNVNFIGGLKWTPDGGKWWTSFALVSGEEQNNPALLPAVADAPRNRTRYSFLLGVTPGGPCGRLEYVFHHHYGWQESGTPQGNFARWYGIDQYLYYRVTNRWKVGARFEWFRDEDGTRVGLNNRPSNPNNPPLPGNYFSLTGGVNYAPTANLSVRPELRWDFTSDTARPAFNDGRKHNQLLLGCDVVWRY